METYVLVPGMTVGGFWMKPVAQRLRSAGYEVYTPTLTGLGERSHLLHPDIDLDTHIQDVLNVLRFENLDNVILVGKSYSGMVITGVAEVVPERIKHLVYVDAFVPQDGQSAADIAGEEVMAELMKAVNGHGDGWLIPCNPDVDPRLTPHPVKTVLQPVILRNQEAAMIPRTYIYCTDKSPDNAWMDSYLSIHAHAAQVKGWRYRELPTDHDPERDTPGELTELLLELATEAG